LLPLNQTIYDDWVVNCRTPHQDSSWHQKWVESKMNFAQTKTANPLGRQHMPTRYGISLASYTKRGTPQETRMPDEFGPAQPMAGFEPTYRNIIDYIVRITYRIWEDRDVEYIRDTYAADSRVFDDYGLQHGCEKIVSDTHHTTGAFSDIKLIADEVIWAGDDKIGYHTSHRTIIRGTNDGPSKYGPATGKSIDVLVIANCVALGNEIFLEHVLYNTSSMIQQLGLDLNAMATSLAKTPLPGWPRDTETWNALRQATRPSVPISVASPIAGFDPDRLERDMFDAVWNRRDLSVIKTYYRQDIAFQGPTDRAFAGLAPYRAFLQSLWATFPDLSLEVDEVYWMGNEVDGFQVVVRWSAEGTHEVAGLYGPPTGRRVQLWGITQHDIIQGQIAREWMLFNELDLMMQIAAARNG